MNKKPIIDLLFVLLPFSSIYAQLANEKRPNILICITDDQSWVHTSFAGEKAITTPAFDKVARDGIYFRNAFCASPSCSPSRGSILTGQEMWRLGEASQLFSAVPKELEKMSFPLLLRDNGYSIGYTQKGWEPNDFKVHGWKEYPLGKGYNQQKLQPPASGIVSNDYAANFTDFLNECPENKPFFFWFGSSEPHRAFEENSGVRHGIDLDKIEIPGFLPDVPEVRNDIADYLFEIKWIDQNLEKMMQLLSERNLLNNTIIIFTSDNGMAFPAAKNNLYEYGIHMPLAIRWPQGIQKGGRIVDDLVSLTDLAPTLLKCAGVKVPEEMTGKSLLKIFNSTSSGHIDKSRKYVFAGKERHTVCRENDLPYPQRSVRDYRFLYIRNLEPDRWPAGAPDIRSAHDWLYGDIDRSPSLTCLIDSKNEEGVKRLFELAVAKRPYEELYDIVNDPFCLTNLISNKNYQKDKKRLAKVLDKYLIKTGDPRALTGKSIWDDFPYYFNNPKSIIPYHNLIDKQ
ncbi:MAG: sulfatase [Bacteroidia bacterium]|nr:sulfatase [Bacteroidia bacterium]